MLIRLLFRTALSAILVLALGVGGALAHASLLGASPANNAVLDAAPPEVRLTFNEPVGLLAITLTGPGGDRHDLSGSVSGPTVTVPLPADLPRGTEALSWHVVSGDGHPIGGTLIFSIGEVTGANVAPTIDPLVAAALWTCRVIIYLALFGGVGAIAFGAVAPLPRAARRVGLGLVAAGLVAAPLSLGLQGVDGLGLTLAGMVNPRSWATGAATTYGATVAAAVAAFLLAAISALLPRRLAQATALLGLATTGLALALSGHASAADPQWLTRPAVFLHVTAIAFWAGALVPLMVLLTTGGPDAERGLARFSAIIPWAIAPLVVSGIVLASVQLGWPGPAWLVPYAALLAMKLCLLVILFGLAAWNRWRLTRPALTGEAGPSRRLVLSVRAEIVLVLVVLGLVAGWRFTPPPRAIAEVLAVPAETHLMSANLMTVLTVEPGRAGPVGISLSLMDQRMKPVTPLSVTLQLSLPSAGIGMITAEAEPGADGIWHADLVLPVSGTWSATVEAQTGKFELRKASGAIDIN
jgi:copper transport protein